eukprot:CAMPEP_0172588342 /NCGR_PEP_ID=MMETSP1068-20121228/7248_1 /TAXON_ID=35684 /ORGANISM="Pseudopedinella elastica, Strain CCMP716" /LENGTH=411 /DNA_ID=CAMNT_0013383633 /DNA_START=96 /DNA_END=1331 /DNA_ORIENTATION=+
MMMKAAVLFAFGFQFAEAWTPNRLGHQRLTRTTPSRKLSPSAPVVSRGRSALFGAATAAAPPNLKPYLEKLVAGESLSKEEAKFCCGAILEGADQMQVSALLLLLRRNGETPEEVAGFAAAMGDACVKVSVAGKMLDIVGTGGDGAHTINISTAAAVLAAAAGAKTAKAGNRSVSSQCGSADVLEALGINLELSAEQVGKCVDECGMGFMFAPVNHPAMKAVVPIRKALGVRSVFNILGPMTNAAGAQRVVIGVFQEELLEIMASSLMAIGNVEHGVVIHGVGLDEISPMGPSSILEIKNTAAPGEPKKYTKELYKFDPLDLGVPRCTVEDLKGGDAPTNAKLMREALKAGEFTDAKRDSIVLNAGVGLYVFGLADSISGGVDLARETLEAGKGLEKLDEWIDLTKKLAAE